MVCSACFFATKAPSREVSHRNSLIIFSSSRFFFSYVVKSYVSECGNLTHFSFFVFLCAFGTSWLNSYNKSGWLENWIRRNSMNVLFHIIVWGKWISSYQQRELKQFQIVGILKFMKFYLILLNYLFMFNQLWKEQ